MACPFFDPATPFSWEEWPNPPRMPLGDPYTGSCTAPGQAETGAAPGARVKTCCNTGYARGACPRFPGGEAPDAVRFGIVKREAGLTTLRYVIERDHHPFDDGILQLQEASAADATVLERQARAFLASYLRRNS
jgi:hypothetical protein